MCGSVIKRVGLGFATGGLSEAGGLSAAQKAAKKVAAAPHRSKVRDIQTSNAASQSKKAATGARISRTRSEQIKRFSSNVSQGGARRASNIGR